MGIGFMSKGFISPILFVLTAASLPIFFPGWRTRPYYLSLGIALLFSLPWLTIWPLLLHQHSPRLFDDWAWTHNIDKWIRHAKAGPGVNSLYYLENLPWLAWPALPLAAWVVWKSRKRLAQREDLQLPLVSFAVMFITLSLAADTAELFALPMLLPITEDERHAQ